MVFSIEFSIRETSVCLFSYGIKKVYLLLKDSNKYYYLSSNMPLWSSHAVLALTGEVSDSIPGSCNFETCVFFCFFMVLGLERCLIGDRLAIYQCIKYLILIKFSTIGVIFSTNIE